MGNTPSEPAPIEVKKRVTRSDTETVAARVKKRRGTMRQDKNTLTRPKNRKLTL